jgi:nucleoid-associated protein YgaU
MEAGSGFAQAAGSYGRKGGLMADPKRSGFSRGVSGNSSTALLDPPAEAETRRPISPIELDATDRMYVVAEGDTLSSIARKFYGNASSRRRILEANWAVIRDPYLIQPGWMLRIPR